MRARNIKPGFFRNEKLAECHPLARILFEGLWCLGDRKGRLEDRPKRIKAEILPYDDVNVEDLLTELASKTDGDGNPAFILRYECNGAKYIQILNFSKHQNPHVKERESTIQAPDKHQTNTGQAPDKNRTRTEEALLIPDSLIHKDKKKPAPPAAFSSSSVPQEETIRKLESISEAIYLAGIFPKVHTFKNAMLKTKKNPQAIIHALTQVSINHPNDPWAYCMEIISVEDGNFNERDHQAREPDISSGPVDQKVKNLVNNKLRGME